MKDIDEKMLELFLSDIKDYTAVMRAIELDQLDICPGISQLMALAEDLASDIHLLDEDAYNDFIQERNKLSLANIAAKKERMQKTTPPHDAIDQRNFKRMILTNFDFPKYCALRLRILRIAKENGWLR